MSDNEGKDSELPPKYVGITRPVDEPIDPEEKLKLEKRRAYNRRCASKARKRNKEQVVYLQTQVLDLTTQNQALKNEQILLASRIQQLTEQNRILVLQQSMPGYAGAAGALPVGGGIQMNNGFIIAAGGAADIPGGMGNFGGGGGFASSAAGYPAAAGQTGIGRDMQGYASLLGRVQEADRAAAEQRLRSTMLLGQAGANNGTTTNNNNNKNCGDAEDDATGNPEMKSSARISSSSNPSDDKNSDSQG